MSRPWFDLAGRLVPSPIGVAFHRRGFVMARVREGMAREVAAVTGDGDWFDDRGQITAAFDFSKLTACLSGDDVAPVQVVLPNPAVRLFALQTEQRLHRRSELERVIGWHAERAGIGAQAMHFDHQWTGHSNGRHHLLVMGAEQRLVHGLCQAAGGRQVRRIVPGIGPALDAAGEMGGEPRLLLDMDREAWSAVALDSRGNVRAARSGWRYGDEGADSVIDEVRRLINVAGEESEPTRACAWCAAEEWPDLRRAIERQFPGLAGNENLRPRDASRAQLAALP